MGFYRSWIAIEGAQEAAQRVLVLLALAVEETEAVMNLGAGGNDRGRAEQMTQRALQVALAFEQSREAHVRFEVAGLAADELTVDGEGFERVFLGDAAGFFEALAHARGAE